MSTASLLNRSPTDRNQPYVFISYARCDTHAAEQIEACLLAAGIHCFRDAHIPKGDDWNQTINGALQECNRMVLLLSSASMATDPYRQEVYDEWFPFYQMAKKIYPFLLNDCAIDRRFVARNYIDARAGIASALNELLQQVRQDFNLTFTALPRQSTQRDLELASCAIHSTKKVVLACTFCWYRVCSMA